MTDIPKFIEVSENGKPANVPPGFDCLTTAGDAGALLALLIGPDGCQYKRPFRLKREAQVVPFPVSKSA